MFVNNKSTIKTFLTSDHHVCPKSPSFNNSPPVKKFSLFSFHIKIHPHICLELFWTVFVACKQVLSCVFLPWFRQDNFFTGGSNIMQLPEAKVFVSYKHAAFASQDINGWTGVVWIACGSLWCFISRLDSHSDGTPGTSFSKFSFLSHLKWYIYWIAWSRSHSWH